MVGLTSGHSDHLFLFAVGIFGFFHMYENIHGDGRDRQNCHQRPNLLHHLLKECGAGNGSRNFDGWVDLGVGRRQKWGNYSSGWSWDCLCSCRISRKGSSEASGAQTELCFSEFH